MNSRQKNIVLILGFLAVLWMAHALSFSKTFALKKQYKNLKADVNLFANSDSKLLQLNQKKVYYDSILNARRLSTSTSFQNNLLTTITNYADTTAIKIGAFENPHSIVREGATINTYAFTVRGSFEEITRLLYTIEQEFKLGTVVSLSYSKKRVYGRRSNYLECGVQLQRISD